MAVTSSSKAWFQKFLKKVRKMCSSLKQFLTQARWDILIYDAAENFKIVDNTIQSVKNICNNFHYSNMDADVPRSTNLSVKVEQYSSKFSKNDARILVQENNEKNEPYSTVCEIYPREFKGSKNVSFLLAPLTIGRADSSVTAVNIMKAPSDPYWQGGPRLFCSRITETLLNEDSRTDAAGVGDPGCWCALVAGDPRGKRCAPSSAGAHVIVVATRLLAADLVEMAGFGVLFICH